MSQLFTWGGQSTGVSTLASFLRKKSQGLSPSEWTGLLIHFHRQLIMWSTGYFVWIHSQTENCKKELQKKKGGGGQKDLIILDLSLFCGSLWFYLKKKNSFLPKCSCMASDTRWTFKRAEENPHSPVSTENRKYVQFSHHNSLWSSHHFYKTENI